MKPEPREDGLWRGLLGPDGYSLALEISAATGNSFDVSATQVWTLIEAGKKANGLERLIPGLSGLLEEGWLGFEGRTESWKLRYVCGLASVREGAQLIAFTAAYVLAEHEKVSEARSAGRRVPLQSCS